MRNGITPVVAMVLLLMMTVAVAGGAYAWFSGMLSGARQEGTQDLNTRLVVKEITCNTGMIDLAVRNDGGVAVDATDADLYVHTMEGDLVARRSGLNVSGAGFTEPDGFGARTVVLGELLRVDHRYRVTLALGSDTEVTGTCRVERGIAASIESCSTGGNNCNGEATCDEQGSRITWTHDAVRSLAMANLTFHATNLETGETCDFIPESGWNSYSIDRGETFVLSTAEPRGSSWGCADTTNALVGEHCSANTMGGSSNHIGAGSSDRFALVIRHVPSGSVVANVTDRY